MGFGGNTGYLVQGPHFDSVPAMASKQQDFVLAEILDARQHSDTLFQLAQDAINKLALTKLPDGLEDPPIPPSIDTHFSENLQFTDTGLPSFGDITQTIPNLNFAADDIVIPDVFGELTTLRGVIADMLATGTGLPPAIEAAIWERDVDRLCEEAVKSEDEAANTWAMRGFQLPPGALIAATLGVQRETADKIAGQSRDVAIKQADLVQKNRQFAVDASIKLAETEASVTLKLIDAYIARARLRLDYLLGQLRAAVEMGDLELKRIQAVAIVFDSSLKRDIAHFDASAKAIQLDITGRTEFAKVQIAQFQANVQVWGTRVTQVIEASKLVLGAVQAVGQLAATIFAGAAAGTSLSAGVQASVNRGENANQSQSESHAESTSTSWTNSVSTSDSTIHNE